MRLSRSQQILLALFLIVVWPFKIASAAELLPLRASYSSIGGAFAPLWLAQDKGLFTKYGLAVELKYILSATGTQALFSGSIDIVNPATEIVEAGLGGQRVAFIIGILNRAVLSVYSKAELRQLTDLRGKVMGVTLPGSTTDLTAKILFQQAGMVPGKDVQVTHLQGMPDIITALTQGRIDAGVVSAPTTLKLRQAGFKELVDVAARNVPMIHAGLATTRDFIKNNPEKVRRYVQVVHRRHQDRAHRPGDNQTDNRQVYQDRQQRRFGRDVQHLRQGLGASALRFRRRHADAAQFCRQPSRQNRETGTVHRQLVRRRVGKVRLH